jgi:hypothetical protein
MRVGAKQLVLQRITWTDGYLYTCHRDHGATRARLVLSPGASGRWRVGGAHTIEYGLALLVDEAGE